jgi:adenosylcobinamide hydrolase
LFQVETHFLTPFLVSLPEIGVFFSIKRHGGTMLHMELSTGDIVSSEDYVLKIHFSQKRNVLSTCAANGGYREDLSDVYNYDSSHKQTMFSEMKAPTLEEHMNIITAEMGLNPATTVGMCTAAQMENVSIQELSYHNVTVTAIVTGGIDINGGRVGDQASWHEKDGKIVSLINGTINIILVIDAILPEGTIATALMTATEAKVAAIQELLLPSRYSKGIATGSGTDKIIVIGNPNAKEKLTDAGKHSKLGECIGRTVMAAVKEALDKQTNANPVKQHDCIKRMERFGITRKSIIEAYYSQELNPADENIRLEEIVDTISKKSELVTYTSLYAHLIDQFLWGLLEKDEVLAAAHNLLDLMDNQPRTGNLDFVMSVQNDNEVDTYLSTQFEKKIISIMNDLMK